MQSLRMTWVTLYIPAESPEMWVLYTEDIIHLIHLSNQHTILLNGQVKRVPLMQYTCTWKTSYNDFVVSYEMNNYVYLLYYCGKKHVILHSPWLNYCHKLGVFNVSLLWKEPDALEIWNVTSSLSPSLRRCFMQLVLIFNFSKMFPF